MTLEAFAKLVEEMRDAQRAYFRERGPERLIAVKQAEAKVDAALRDLPERK